MQSKQDDLFPELETFAQSVYQSLVLAALKRELNEDEIAVLGVDGRDDSASKWVRAIQD